MMNTSDWAPFAVLCIVLASLMLPIIIGYTVDLVSTLKRRRHIKSSRRSPQ